MHPPTTPAHREAALRFQAEQLLRDAAAWGYYVSISFAEGDDGVSQRVSLLRAVYPPVFPPPVFPPPVPFDPKRYRK